MIYPIRLRPPRFPLVLSALVAGAGLAVLLLGGSGGSSQKAPTLGIGSSRACVSTRAQAEVTVTSAVVITATVHAPVTVIQSASGPNGTATVTRSEIATATDRATRPLAVKRTETAEARACASAGSVPAAREAALHRAYARALLAARKHAVRSAKGALRALQHFLFPSVLAQARHRAAARAHSLALAAEPALAAQARADARRRAGG